MTQQLVLTIMITFVSNLMLGVLTMDCDEGLGVWLQTLARVMCMLSVVAMLFVGYLKIWEVI